MLNDAFSGLVDAKAIDLNLAPLRAESDALAEDMYARLNNGVYRAAFATTRLAHDEAVEGVFDMLDTLEARLEGRSFFVGDRLTEAYVRDARALRYRRPRALHVQRETRGRLPEPERVRAAAHGGAGAREHCGSTTSSGATARAWR